MRNVVFATAMLFSTVAAAEPPGDTPARAPQRDRSTALWMSLSTTLGGLGLVLVAADVGIRPQAYPNEQWLQPPLVAIGSAALLVGPSLGSAYAGRFWNGGTGMRLAGLAIAGAGFAEGLASRGEGASVDPGPYLMLAAGGFLYLVGATYEIATTPRAVDLYNREHGVSAQLSLAPIRARDGSIAPGVSLSGQF